MNFGREYEPYHKYDYGFSFWLAVVALQLAGIDVIVAILTVCLGEEDEKLVSESVKLLRTCSTL
ncbi:hypothetical protein ANCCEY_09414 [Ancylostoma ceylanicum]|uniref:Anoctamin n=1 Tax=Ancylostoma ceylanicum TaxID=53326 RepID=A0A0D6LV08_9BILA|nr:hypothetical protein ANCCEY_09414 [Ancylostoma ceylanicum]